MAEFRAFGIEDAVTTAAAALSLARGHSVRIAAVQNLGGDERRNLVLRGTAQCAGGAAQPIIIKATRASGYNPSAVDAFEKSGLAKEWAATTLLADATPRLAHYGALLAADLAQGVLVFSDFGEALPSLVKPLLHGSALEAEDALTAYAVSLAHLHAATLGCRAKHAGIVQKGFPAATISGPGRTWIDDTARKAPVLLGGTLPDAELEMIAARLHTPGPWLALAHRDPCPDNVLITPDGRALLIDFEFASPGHALLDAAYWRMGFPTCWCAGAVPEPVGDRIEQAYRAILASAAPVAADDDAFQRERTIISAAWLLGNLAWLLEGALREDTRWGIAMRRSRILHYLDTLVGMARAAEILPGLHDIAARWRDQLGKRWPDSATLAPYPAFAQPADAARQ